MGPATSGRCSCTSSASSCSSPVQPSPRPAAGLETARRRTNPAEIAQLLGLARVGVPLVGVGTALVLGSGVWLVDLGNWGWDGWIVAALGLLGASAAIGTAAGQWPKRARRLAGQLAAAGKPPTTSSTGS